MQMFLTVQGRIRKVRACRDVDRSSVLWPETVFRSFVGSLVKCAHVKLPRNRLVADVPLRGADRSIVTGDPREPDRSYQRTAV
jgi:hypothetical protein